MPIDRPSIADLRAQTQMRLRAAFPSATFLRRSVLAALADTISGAIHLTLAFVEQGAKQAHPAYSEGDELTALAKVWNLTRNAPSAAIITLRIGNYGGAEIFGVGSVFTVGSRQFTVTSGVLGAGNADAFYDFTAAANDTGAIEEIAPDTTADIALTGDDVSKKILTFANGAGEESDALLRQRLAEQIRRPNLCGTREDWIAHLKAQAGITQAFVRDSGGAAQLAWIYGGRNNPQPTTAEADAVLAALEIYRPAGIQLTVLRPSAQDINLTLGNFGLPDEYERITAEMQLRMTAAIRQLVNERLFIGGFTTDSILPKSWIAEAAAMVVPGVRFYVKSPSDEIVIDEDKFPRIASVAYEGTDPSPVTLPIQPQPIIPFNN